MKKSNLLMCVCLLFFTLISCDKEDDNEPVKSDKKAITAFSFLAKDNDVLSADSKGSIDQDKKTITVELPEGTSVTALRPTIAISENASVNPENQKVTDFTSPVVYTVTAEDDTTVKYTVTVNVKKSDEKQITSFVFPAADNEGLSEDVSATINQDASTISGELPFGTNLSGLKPTITASDFAMVDPKSKTETDFSSPVVYTVTAANGSTRAYTVTLTVNTTITDRDVLIAWYKLNPNNTLSWDFSKEIDEWEGITVENERVVRVALRDNGLSVMTPLISHLSELRTLELVEQGITSLPPEIGKLQKLEAMDMTHNSLTFLPEEIGDLTVMKLLQFHNNDIQQLPASIGKLSLLIELDLTFNDLRSLPTEIGNLKSLLVFSVYGSRQLEVIPSSIGNLTELYYLSFGWCNIASIPKEIGNLTKLNELRVDENRLTQIPSELGNLTAVKSLKLQKNQLTELPEELGMLANLVELNIQENNITLIPKEICDLDVDPFTLIKDPEAKCEP
ncbi:DUF5018 domain-containing protein [Maribacter sp. 2210JD10-5]|uniref:leucine-rich repeat domain-containing protein n=1 Tax=Maribacter sp. 2210JD10-5 TaxID=3386272 RepID=UPI0039BC9705